MNCSLNKHRDGYDVTALQVVQGLVFSPYASRHWELSNSGKINSTEKWGHRIIAFVEGIPLVGFLASIIERIVVFVLSTFQKKPVAKPNTTIIGGRKVPLKVAPSLNRVKIKQAVTTHSAESQQKNKFHRLNYDVVNKITEYLDIRETNRLACVVANDYQEKIFKAKIAKLWPDNKIRGKKDFDLFKCRKADELLLEFCEHIPECKDKIDELNGETEAKAQELREWLASDPKIAAITELNLYEKGIKGVPLEIALFKNLKKLMLSCNDISVLPKEIGSLVNLEILDLAENSFIEVPKEIGLLTNLSNLFLPHNNLSFLPKELFNLRKLEDLNLGFNFLSEMPSEIGNLTELTDLFLMGNKLETLPTEIEKLQRLNSLNLRDMKFKSLPKEIEKLPAKATIHISKDALPKGKFPKHPGLLKN